MRPEPALEHIPQGGADLLIHFINHSAGNSPVLQTHATSDM